MSLDSAEASPSSSRDWFFPSPSFIHSTSNSPQSPNYPRKFSTIPRHSRSSHTDWKPPKTSTFRSVSSSGSAAYGDPKYGRVRRRIELRRREKMAKQEKEDPVLEQKRDVSKAVSGVKTAIGEMGIRDFGQRVKIRWQMASYIAILITAFGSLVHKNFSLHNQVIDLQDQISTMNIRLQACNTSDTFDTISILQEGDHLSSKGLKILALTVSIALLSMPLFVFKYIDYISKFRSSYNCSEKVSLNKQLEYRVDVLLSVHPYAKALALLVATLMLICLGGLALFGVTDDSLADCLWLSWTYVADSGNHANSEGMGPRLVSVSISFGGMLIFAMMLGLVSDAISEKLDSLRKGRSEVVEQNHTLILGWSDKLVSVSKARAIVVLADDGNADQSDARALRTVLSLTGVKEGLRGHIVVELSDLDNEVLVKLVGGELVETVVAHDVIGRLMIQCARQPGLAQIWEDILGFENCEFYIKRWPQLDGMQFEDVLISFPDAIPCGVKVASRGGKIILNPEDSYVLQGGDEVLVIAEDDDTYAPGALPMEPKGTGKGAGMACHNRVVNGASFMHIARPARKPQKILLCGWRRDVWRGSLAGDFIVPKLTEKILLCGWRRDMEDMIMVLDAFLAPGSELWMFNEVVESERERKLIDGGLDLSRLVNITLVHREGNAVIRRHLESLPLESFDSILILADESVEDSAIQADSRSLATLLLIRDIQGNELHIRLAELYLHEGEEMSFYEIILRARQKREIVIGYRLENAERAVINPPNKNKRRRWSVKDVFVVITEKE
ncbi:hypothetical protein GOBAR_DD36166 [Gossypium barbadense]|nr:hypothetical protein GOBAR_DD36166 [Gossypium barbadense]